MNNQIGSVASAKRCLPFIVAIATITVLMLSGCSNSSETPGSESTNMNNFTTDSTEFSAALNDPSGYITGLKFLSAEDNAIYQCLLSAATASATTRGLQAYPVTTINRPEIHLYNVGVKATWCKTVGEGSAVDADISACRSNGDFSAPGTVALQLIAAPDFETAGWDNTVERIELKSFKIPEQGSMDFKVEFWIIRGGEQNRNFFNLAFIPRDGNTYNRDLRVSIGSNYVYIEPDIDLFEYYQPAETIAEQKSLLASSAIQLRTTATTNYEALKVQVEIALNADSSLDANAKQAALAKAITEIDRRINVINQYSEVFHRHVLEQIAIEECG